MKYSPFRLRFSIPSLVSLAMLALSVLPVILPAAQAATAPEQVRLHLKWLHQFQFAGYYAALEQGYFAREGLDVELIEGGPGHAPIREMLSGEVEYAVADCGVVLSRERGEPVVMLAPIFQHSPQVMYTRDDVHTAADLRAKRVMMQDGFLTIEVLAMLRQAGLADADFTRQPIGTIEDLIDKRTDAFPGYSTNEGFALQGSGTPFHMFSPRDYGIDFYGDVLVTSEAELRNHPERVAAMRRAVLLGWQYALKHPQQIIKLIQTHYNSQHKSDEHLSFEAAAIADLMEMELIPVGFSNPGRWHQIAAAFAGQGFAVDQIDWEAFLYEPDSSQPGWFSRNRYTLILAVMSALLLLLYLYNIQLKRGIRKRTQQLEAVSSQYRDILDHMQDAYYRADLNGNLIWISLASERHLGYARDEIIGKKIDLLYAKRDERQRFLAALAVAGGDLQHYEICLRHRDGGDVWAEVNAQYFYDQAGELAGVEGNVRNISERKQSEQESHELTAQLQRAQKMESIGVLAGGIAHDFNNLLVGVMGNAELALMDAPDNSEMRSYLQHIFNASQRGADLVRQMLAYSGQGRFLMGEQYMNGLITDVSELLATVIGKKVVLKQFLAEGLPAVYGDKNQLTQLVMNLITNASEAIQDHVGTIEIRTGVEMLVPADFAGMYLANQHKAGHYIYLSVEDDGCGMDTATQARIFDPFFTTKETGSGLGLSALLGIIRSHGGALSLESASGKGTCFTVYLPALPSALPSAPRSQAQPAQSAQSAQAAATFITLPGTVLLVDDEAAVRDVAGQMLARAGIHVLKAEDGEAGVELFRKHADDISLVLLDLTMPKMDGEEVFHALQAIRPGVPVLLSSGFSESEAIERLQQHGLAGFVRKPYTRKTLLAKIEALAIIDRRPDLE
ncbi:MAG: ABC transporter substrate-binding protein [Mariprofundus sp.]